MTNPKEIVNRRTQERLCFYNDASDTDSDGAPTGKGYIQCDIWDATGAFVGNFPDGGGGIGGILADDGLIGAMFTRNPTSMIEVRFPGGAFRSYDDGRTWGAAGDAPATAAIRVWRERLRSLTRERLEQVSRN